MVCLIDIQTLRIIGLLLQIEILHAISFTLLELVLLAALAETSNLKLRKVHTEIDLILLHGSLALE
jgi:hypothetical protein